MRPARPRVLHVAMIDDSLKYLLKDQLRHLIARGWEVQAMSSPGRWRGELEAAGIRFHPAPLFRRVTPIADLRAIAAIAGVCRRERIDVVHTHVAKAALLGQIAARLARVPHTVNTVHGFLFTDFSTWSRRAFFLNVERAIAFLSDRVMFQSREKLETAVRLGICPPDKAVFIGNGVDASRFDPARAGAEARRRVRAELGIQQDAIVVGMVAFYAREKGHVEFHQAARLLAEHFPTMRFVTTGIALAQGIRLPVDAGIVERMGLTGRVVRLEDRQDMPDLYAAMDIVALPSYREGLPRCLMEAAMMARPIVASDISGVREVVEDGVNGLLVPVRDARALAHAIARLAADPDLRWRMGEAGRARALRSFDERQVFASVENTYAEILGRHHPAALTPERALSGHAEAVAAHEAPR